MFTGVSKRYIKKQTRKHVSVFLHVILKCFFYKEILFCREKTMGEVYNKREQRVVAGLQISSDKQ
jgi:hypothetical protein